MNEEYISRTPEEDYKNINDYIQDIKDKDLETLKSKAEMYKGVDPKQKITLAGETVPAGVIIIGKTLLSFSAASMTALYPARLACELSASIF